MNKILSVVLSLVMFMALLSGIASVTYADIAYNISSDNKVEHPLMNNTEDGFVAPSIEEYNDSNNYLTRASQFPTQYDSRTKGYVTIINSSSSMEACLNGGGNDNYAFKTLSKWASMVNQQSGHEGIYLPAYYTFRLDDVEYILVG